MEALIRETILKNTGKRHLSYITLHYIIIAPPPTHPSPPLSFYPLDPAPSSLPVPMPPLRLPPKPQCPPLRLLASKRSTTETVVATYDALQEFAAKQAPSTGPAAH